MAGLLYKQGIQKLEIIIRKDTNGGASGTKGLATSKASASQSEDLGEDIDESTKKKTLKQFAIAGVISIVKQTAFWGFDYYVGGIGMRNGDQALQDQINAKLQIYKDTINVGTSLATGAIAGSVFGPVGALVGGLLGSISSGLNIAGRNMEQKRQYDLQVFKENNAINYNKARAGRALTDGRNK